MRFERDGRLGALRRIAGLTAALQAIGLWEIAGTARELQATAASARWTLLFGVLGLAFAASLAFFAWSLHPSGRRLPALLERAARRLSFFRPFTLPIAAAGALALPLLALSPQRAAFENLTGLFGFRAIIFWLACLAGAAMLAIRRPDTPFTAHLAAVTLLFAAIHRAAAFLPDLSANPFSLGWSEGSRYYYASLYFAEKIYERPLDPTVLHPTRYMMQAAPFMFGSLPPWFHRAWQVFLWLAANGAAAWLLALRLRRRGKVVLPGQNHAKFQRSSGAAPAPGILLVSAWAFLFLFQGPVWYHLVVMIIIVLWGADSEKFWKTLAVVGAASIWAGMSRINWIPFPAALAGLLYFIESPLQGRSPWKYLAPPFFWGLAGGALGLLSQGAYALLSGNALEQFGSSFTSDLLWYRLWPSATFPLGVLPGILLVMLPPALVLGTVLRGKWAQIGALRLFGLGGILAVFFAGGLVVSVKIGGGSNLHNLDGFIALLLAATAVLVFQTEHGWGCLRPGLIALAIAVPAAFALTAGAPLPDRDLIEEQRHLAALTGLVEAAAAQGGEVLFIAERQLLTFGYVEGVPLVEDYEKVFLMEMAMAGSPDYLGAFEADLSGHRFALIVTDAVRFNLQSELNEFGEENNIWDQHVSHPLLCYYEPVLELESIGVEVLAPAAEPDCPEP